MFTCSPFKKPMITNFTVDVVLYLLKYKQTYVHAYMYLYHVNLYTYNIWCICCLRPQHDQSYVVLLLPTFRHRYLLQDLISPAAPSAEHCLGKDRAVDATLDHPHASAVPEDVFRSESFEGNEGWWIDLQNACAGRFVCCRCVYKARKILEPNNVIYWLRWLPMRQCRKERNMNPGNAVENAVRNMGTCNHFSEHMSMDQIALPGSFQKVI